jgi:GntR family transcriptional regulator/MocR family aminotransferase
MIKTTNQLIHFDISSQQPLYMQIYERFREAIAEGLLKPGDRVPSMRSLAAELNLARGTIETAYEILNGEGYFLSRGQAGTVVAPSIGVHTTHIKQREVALEQLVFRPNISNSRPPPLQMGLPALDAFPRKLWAKIGCRVLKAASANDMIYTDPLGLMSLRVALSAYLKVSRGISCRPAQIVITDGYRGSLDLICRTFLEEGQQVWMEDPGYYAARDLMRAAGGEIVPVPVDNQGLIVKSGIAKARSAKIAIVTPSHQSPLGVTLSLARRLELLDWANEQKSWIIEDDYDGEYRYTSRPLPALKSLDLQDRVIYAGTLSKVILPALRLAYLVIPESQVSKVEGVCQIFQNGCPWSTQATVKDFIAEGHFARHLKKMRTLYKHRRGLLSQAIYDALGDEVHVDLQAGGMHLVVRLNKRYDDQYLVKHLNENGLAIQALSSWSEGSNCGQGLVMSFTNIHSIEYANSIAQRLKELIRSS